MHSIKKIVCLLLLVLFTTTSFAWWGTNGHRIIGEIAEKHLSLKAQKAVLSILGTESVGMAATWADFIKSDSTLNYLGPWHYINIQQGLAYNDFKNVLLNDTAVDAYTKLNFLIKELKTAVLTTDKKLMYLHLLIHIVGDVHQPMHVSRAEDQGGNKIKVLWFNESTNLHSVWDDKLVEFQKLSYTEYATALDHTTKQQRQVLQSQPMEQWFFESYQIAGQLYSEITQPDQKLSYKYNYDHIETMNQQLLKAGIRLAGLLNTIFG
jgi:S1/P1 Nuclease